MPVSVEESVRHLRERARRRSAERERRELEVREAAIGALRAALPPGGRGWLIGSVVWGGFGERSDIDLVLAGVTDNQVTRIEDAVARATGVEVDVLDFAVLPLAFQERITSEGVSVT